MTAEVEDEEVAPDDSVDVNGLDQQKWARHGALSGAWLWWRRLVGGSEVAELPSSSTSAETRKRSGMAKEHEREGKDRLGSFAMSRRLFVSS